MRRNVRPIATIVVFPVFYETASSMAMQKPALLVVKKAIEFVNPGQVPVIEGIVLYMPNNKMSMDVRGRSR